MKFQLKTGAMFGLDARIALAIFGALSVISGAALYSAIQQSKVVNLITDLKEIGKAWEQYYLDTGEQLPFETVYTSNYLLETAGLVDDKGVKGWKGPYLPYRSESYFMKHTTYNNAHAAIMKDNTAARTACDAVDPCGLYTAVNGVSLDMAKAVDLYIDGVDDKESGSFVYNTYSGIPGTYSVYLKINAVKKD
jgi:hypothetical protein